MPDTLNLLDVRPLGDRVELSDSRLSVVAAAGSGKQVAQGARIIVELFVIAFCAEVIVEQLTGVLPVGVAALDAGLQAQVDDRALVVRVSVVVGPGLREADGRTASVPEVDDSDTVGPNSSAQRRGLVVVLDLRLGYGVVPRLAVRGPLLEVRDAVGPRVIGLLVSPLEVVCAVRVAVLEHHHAARKACVGVLAVLVIAPLNRERDGVGAQACDVAVVVPGLGAGDGHVVGSVLVQEGGHGFVGLVAILLGMQPHDVQPLLIALSDLRAHDGIGPVAVDALLLDLVLVALPVRGIDGEAGEVEAARAVGGELARVQGLCIDLSPLGVQIPGLDPAVQSEGDRRELVAVGASAEGLEDGDLAVLLGVLEGVRHAERGADARGLDDRA